MAMMDKTRNILEGFMEGSFKWALSRRTSFDDEFEELSRSPSGRRKWIPELSQMANVIVGRCSQILDVSMDELQRNFESEASDGIKHTSNYSRNLLEYCCFRALVLMTQVIGHLADPKFRRLTFDMMLAWEASSTATPPSPRVGKDGTVGLDAFLRIAPAVPIIADVITCSNIFDVLANPNTGQLSFHVYEKYLGGLDRAIKKMKSQTESSHLSYVRSERGERILEVDGTLTTQPVLEHVGISTWPGRLTLTDHALYFEALKVVTYDKAKVYDLANDLKQLVRPELTGPWGSRLFDKAVMYKSISLSEPVIMEFPELTGHSRRDYWLALIQEIMLAHRFIRKFKMEGIDKEEALSKAALGILRLQAIHDTFSSVSVRNEALLMFNLSDKLPGGDLILEAVAAMIVSKSLARTNRTRSGPGMYSISSLAILSNLGAAHQSGSDEKLLVGDIVVGQMTNLEKVVRESRDNYKMVEQAQATVDGVKVDGIDTNLAVMLELLYPLIEIGKKLMCLAQWEDSLKSLIFCSLFSYIIFRGWLGYLFAGLLLFMAVFMLLTKFCNQGRPIDEVKVLAPPPMNAMEQLLAVQNAISQVEEFVQDGNIILLKLRALLFAISSQATDKAILILILVAISLALFPGKLLLLMIFLELFTRYSPLRRSSTERWTRRLREWWFSVPAAPVVLEKNKDDKKKR
ncbi:hypothetical protein HPP92_027455 [Vanilla planifolia]|uniref:Uncharacterized protein n=1 Tax=Vanilla planifolia TaxID=51239 RepID=A0A835U4E0_VANPL|nr:hypothetical protein HPP92_027455 [Vanilla planifolia]KAG0449218.1 hypothetical protein HPP92_027473 [Vanilla planifolia]